MSSIAKSTETPTDEPGAPSRMTPHERLAEIHSLLDQVLSTSTSHDMLELAMATAISQRLVLHGPPLWLLFEGPPSSGKTSVVSLLKGASAGPERFTVFAPKITLGSLTSGFKDAKGKRAPALLREFHTRCWCNTEFSTLLTGDAKSVSPILGVLTAAFDGDFSAAFGNVTEQGSAVLNLETRFSLLGCITPQVRQQHTRLVSQLGPRFLSYRVPPLTSGEEQRAFRLVQDPQRAGRIRTLQRLVTEHSRAALAEARPVEIPETTEAILQVLSRLVAAGRTPVVYEGSAARPDGGEDSIRAYQQLRGLALSLAVIHGTPTPSPRALRLVRDVALSSFEPRRAEVLFAQRTNPVLAFQYPPEEGRPVVYLHGMTAPRLAEVTGWSPSTSERVLEELAILGLYELAEADVMPVLEPGLGRSASVYVPTPGLTAVMSATFEDYPPRLVTAVALALDREGAFNGCLSPADHRLAVGLAERRAELDHQLRESAARFLQEHPDLDLGDLVLRMIQEVVGVPSPTPGPMGEGGGGFWQEPLQSANTEEEES